MIETRNYYSVTTKCGHVGKKYFIPISFPICASSKKEAAYIARSLPRVKHNHKDAIIKVERINYCNYLILIYKNKNDPYLKCKNKKEQDLIIDLDKRFVKDEYYYDYMKRKKKKKERNNKFKLLKEKCIIESFKNEQLNYQFN